ncbi:hypothetical protein [Streptomyces sparsus]
MTEEKSAPKARKGVLLSSVAAGVILSSLTVAYLGDYPPFESRGRIEAEEMCQSLGDAEHAARDVANVVPHSPQYTFSDKPNGYTSAYSYHAGCTVLAEDVSALSVVSELVTDMPTDRWIEENLHHNIFPEKEKPVRFQAGKGAVSTSRTASVWVPCRAVGEVPGGQRNLSVSAIAAGNSDVDEETVRQSVANLAVSAARYAHKDTDCSLPSKLPKRAPGLEP